MLGLLPLARSVPGARSRVDIYKVPGLKTTEVVGETRPREGEEGYQMGKQINMNESG